MITMEEQTKEMIQQAEAAKAKSSKCQVSLFKIHHHHFRVIISYYILWWLMKIMQCGGTLR